jgi:hypothetical protein
MPLRRPPGGGDRGEVDACSTSHRRAEADQLAGLVQNSVVCRAATSLFRQCLSVAVLSAGPDRCAPEENDGPDGPRPGTCRLQVGLRTEWPEWNLRPPLERPPEEGHVIYSRGRGHPTRAAARGRPHDGRGAAITAACTTGAKMNTGEAEAHGNRFTPSARPGAARQSPAKRRTAGTRRQSPRRPGPTTASGAGSLRWRARLRSRCPG